MSSFSVVICPHCQAHNQPDVIRCWLCGEPLAAGEGRTEIFEAEVVGPGDPRSGASYVLTALLVIVVLVAVAIGAWNDAPGLSILLLVVATPAVLATLARVFIRRRRGEKITGWKTALDLLMSALVVAFLGVSVASIVIVCFAVYLFIVCTQGFNIH